MARKKSAGEPDNCGDITENLWSFNYRKGPVLVPGIVRARDEATAFLVATAWCERNGCRPCARVTPMILADESILKLPFGPREEESGELALPVEATTAVNVTE